MYEPYFVKDVLNASEKNLFTVISCFAGAGGSSTGYRMAGGNVLLINEFVASAIESYRQNYPDTPVLVDDIKNHSGAEFLEVTRLKPGELDILDGSPPCSAFSVAGKREKGWDKEKSYSDGKKIDLIEDLFLEFIRVAKDIQPKVIVAENVKGITFGEARKKLAQFVNAFEEIGYQITHRVMNAADFGVPQARERTIFICVRDDICEALDLNFMTIGSVFPEPTVSKHVSLREAIENLQNDEDEVQMLADHVQNSWQKKWVEMLPFNPTRHTKCSDTQFLNVNPKRSLFNMIRPCPTLPSPTITQQGNQMGLSGVLHYEENRKFTILELKRIMGLPEDYELSGSFNEKAERIGRMVAPKMMAEIARSIYERVLKPYNER